MAYGDMSNDELYGDQSPSQSEASQEPKEDQGKRSAVLPSSICPGMKPGDTMELHIDEVREGQYLVSYEKGESRDEEAREHSEPPSSMAPSSDMSSMME